MVDSRLVTISDDHINLTVVCFTNGCTNCLNSLLHLEQWLVLVVSDGPSHGGGIWVDVVHAAAVQSADGENYVFTAVDVATLDSHQGCMD